MPKKSPFTERLDLVQTQFSGLLRPLGFRKTGRTYHRSSPDNLVQVVNLQIWRPDPVPPTLAASHAPGAHDRFTVNLGVWIPEVSEYHLGPLRGKTVHEYDCHVRARLGELATPARDIWWPLDDSWPDSAAESVRLFHQQGLPWLEAFGSRDGIIAKWTHASDAKIIVAIIEAKRGRPETARQLLEQQIRGSQQRGHREYVRTLGVKLGMGPLPADGN